jgi:hypothetical protein
LDLGELYNRGGGFHKTFSVAKIQLLRRYSITTSVTRGIIGSQINQSAFHDKCGRTFLLLPLTMDKEKQPNASNLINAGQNAG